MAEAEDDFLNPDEIDALLNASKDSTNAEAEDAAKAASPAPRQNPPKSGPVDSAKSQPKQKPLAESLDVDDADDEPDPAKTIEQAQTHLDEALADGVRMSNSVQKFGAPSAYALESFGSAQRPARAKQPLEILQDVELDLRIELGRTEMLIEEVVELKEGSVVTLDKLAGDPVDILVNGRLIARGEVLVLNDNFCVRVGEILTPDV